MSGRHLIKSDTDIICSRCKSFKWYLDTVYPELFVPGEALAKGELRNKWEGHGNQMCIDSPAKKGDLNKPVGLYPCHNQVAFLLVFDSNLFVIQGRQPILDVIEGGRDQAG